MTLITSLANMVFSSELPDLTFSTPSEKVNVELQSDGATVFETSLYAYGDSVTICDLREIIEGEMDAVGLSYMPFTLVLTGDSNDSLQKDFSVVYCSKRIETPAQEWVRSHFLTTLAARRTTRQAWEALPFFAIEGEDITEHYKVTLRYGKIYRTIDFNSQRQEQEDTGVCYLVVGHAFIKNLVSSLELEGNIDIDPEIANSPDEIVAWTVSVGERVASYYLDEAETEISMMFRNCFNASDFAHFNGTTTAKSKLTKSEAMASHMARYYDFRLEKTFEVTTGPLTREEAIWLEQLTLSRSVRLVRQDTINQDLFPLILISDSDVSISDDDRNVNKITFTWRFADDRDHLPIEQPSADIFKIQFDKTFK